MNDVLKIWGCVEKNMSPLVNIMLIAGKWDVHALYMAFIGLDAKLIAKYNVL